jgi:hypothetical protein
VQQLGQSASAGDDSRRREVDAAMQADAQKRGATVDPQVSKDSAAGASVRQAMFNSYGAMLAGQGRANTDYADTLAHVVAPGQKLQAQAQNARGTTALRSKLTDLKSEKGAYKQSFLDSLTDSERKNVLAAQVAGVDTSLKVTALKETIRHNKAGDRNNKKKTQADIEASKNDPSKQKTAADLAFFKEHGYYPPTGPPKTKGNGDPAKEPLTRNEQNHVIEPIQNAQAWISKLKAQGKTPTQIRTVLLQGLTAKSSDGKSSVNIPSYDRYAVNAAMDMVYNGYLSPANVHELRRRGVKPARYFPVQPKGHVKGVFG